MSNFPVKKYIEIRLRAVSGEAQESPATAIRMSALLRFLHGDLRRNGNLPLAFPGYIARAEGAVDGPRGLGKVVRVFGEEKRLSGISKFLNERLGSDIVISKIGDTPSTQKQVVFSRFKATSRSRARRPKKINGVLVERENGMAERALHFQQSDGLPFFVAISLETGASFSIAVERKTRMAKPEEGDAPTAVVEKLSSYGLGEKGKEVWLPDF